MKHRIATAVIAACGLSGCSTYVSMIIQKPVTPPSSPPRIIRDQVALLWGSDTELTSAAAETWRKTGLFKEVKLTTDRYPSAQGTYISMACTTYPLEHSELAHYMMWLLTAGMMFTSRTDDTTYCDTRFFQNGALLSEIKAEFEFRSVAGSWVYPLLYRGDKVLNEGRTAAAAHVVATQLDSLKKAYP